MYTLNHMENVPVKIAEKYRQPPLIYETPQVIANKLLLPSNHYKESPQYEYDFKLEHKAIAKLPEWRHIRQREKDARRERKERREQQSLREAEARQKHLLGNVSYPNADDLSSSGSEEDFNGSAEATANKIFLGTEASNFHNILKPTILSQMNSQVTAATGSCGNTKLLKSDRTVANGKFANTFNYKDFEEDTSSPFDNIELKSINDLDILAQVLNNTELKANEQKASDEVTVKINEISEQNHSKEEIDVSSECLSDENNQHVAQTNYPDRCSQNHLQPSWAIERQPHSDESYKNQNYLNMPLTDDRIAIEALKSNSNNKMIYSNINNYKDINDTKSELKTKSVPDILKELSEEVCNSKIRRFRNNSNNADNELLDSAPQVAELQQQTTPRSLPVSLTTYYYEHLDTNAQQLAKQISSMGFPLERVAKIMQIVGPDDKKIIEHLILLGELVDLGFDEAIISEALLKCDNNKERALEYLIS